jgi:hypothetical protein
METFSPQRLIRPGGVGLAGDDRVVAFRACQVALPGAHSSFLKGFDAISPAIPSSPEEKMLMNLTTQGLKDKKNFYSKAC